jgi:hypothetical protein
VSEQRYFFLDTKLCSKELIWFSQNFFVSYHQFNFCFFFFVLGTARFVRIFTQIKVMKVIEKDFVVGGAKLGTYLTYDDVEEVLASPKPRERVLPAPFFYEKRLFFFLIKRHEPGTPFWPKGGYEVRDESGGIRCYDLDQVILHPAVIKHKKTLDKMARVAEKAAKQRDRALKRGSKPPKEKVEGARRGRPAIDPAVKAAREAERVLRAQRSGGKRGRPASSTANPQTPKAASGGKRGRPALSAAQVTAKATAKAATRARSGGRRGRPKSTR